MVYPSILCPDTQMGTMTLLCPSQGHELSIHTHHQTLSWFKWHPIEPSSNTSKPLLQIKQPKSSTYLCAKSIHWQASNSLFASSQPKYDFWLYSKLVEFQASLLDDEQNLNPSSVRESCWPRYLSRLQLMQQTQHPAPWRQD